MATGSPAPSDRPLRLMLVPNEDGFGPTMAVFHLLRGLLNVARQKGVELQILLQGGKQQTMSRLVDQELSEHKSRIIPIPVRGVIQLVKDPRGLLDVEKTRNSLVGVGSPGYATNRSAYATNVKETLKTTDAVVSFGSPEILNAASIAEREIGTPIRRFEVFDHSWSLTIANIFGSEQYREEYERRFGRSYDDDDAAKRVVALIRDDEAKAERVWLFPEFITSSDYFSHWKGLMKGRPVARVEGVFGGIDRSHTAKKSEWQKSRETIGRWLGLANDVVSASRIVVVQAGGTQLWDEVLGDIILECYRMDKTGDLRNIFLFQKFSVEALLAKMESDRSEVIEGTKEALQAVLDQKTERIRCIGDDVCANWQRVFVGADLIFSRAGGITVQDAVACLTPIVCVEELGQWQTEKIRRMCDLHRIAETVFHAAFKAAAIGPILHHLNAYYSSQDTKGSLGDPGKPKEPMPIDRL